MSSLTSNTICFAPACAAAPHGLVLKKSTITFCTAVALVKSVPVGICVSLCVPSIIACEATDLAETTCAADGLFEFNFQNSPVIPSFVSGL